MRRQGKGDVMERHGVHVERPKCLMESTREKIVYRGGDHQTDDAVDRIPIGGQLLYSTVAID